MLHASTGTPTKAQERRFQLIKLESGCICCRLRGLGYTPPEIHHLIDGGRRRGHDETIGLCQWHHQGYAPDGWTPRTYRELAGPSLKDGTCTFREAYGTDDELLAAQNRLLQQISLLAGIGP